MRRSCVSSVVISLVLLCVAPLTDSVAEAGESPYADVPRVSPVWSRPVDGTIQWMRVTSLGRLVVASTGGLYGIDPESGKALWHQDALKTLDPGQYGEIPGTALIVVGSDAVKSRTVILDSVHGAVVFDSRGAGIVNLMGKQVLYETGGLLVMGRQEGEFPLKLFLVDLATGKTRWVNDKPFGAAGKLVGMLAALADLVPEGVMESDGDRDRAVEVGAGAFLLDSGGEIRKFDSETGEILWTIRNADGDGNVSFFASPEYRDAIVVATEVVMESTSGSHVSHTKYAAYRLSDGAAVWEKSIKVKGTANSPVFLPDGVIVSPGGDVKGKIKFVEYASGQSKWGKKGKGIDSQGGIVDHDLTAAGLVVTTGFDSAWNDRGTEYFLNVLDVKTGAYRFPKALKVRGRMLLTEVGPKGVLYVTTREAGIFDPATGTRRHDNPIRTDGVLVIDRRGDVLYAFSKSDGALYALNTTEGSQKKLSDDKVKLEGDDVPRSLDVRDDVIFVVSSQNLVAFGHDGAVQFHRYYPAPRHPAWVRALLIAQSVRLGMAAAASGVSSAAFAEAAASQSQGSIEQEVAEQFSDGYGQLAEGYAGLTEDYAREAGRRFKASAESGDHVFMMVRLKGSNGLAQVDKRSGKVVGVIHLGSDKDPAYQVDDIARRVYYRTSASEIVGFGFDASTVASK